MSAGSIISIIFAVLLAIFAIVSIVRKRLCITFVGKTQDGERTWVQCTEGTRAIVGGFLILLAAVGIALWAILA